MVAILADVTFCWDLGHEAVLTREGVFLVSEERDLMSFLGDASGLVKDIRTESSKDCLVEKLSGAIEQDG